MRILFNINTPQIYLCGIISFEKKSERIYSQFNNSLVHTARLFTATIQIQLNCFKKNRYRLTDRVESTQRCTTHDRCFAVLVVAIHYSILSRCRIWYLNEIAILAQDVSMLSIDWNLLVFGTVFFNYSYNYYYVPRRIIPPFSHLQPKTKPVHAPEFSLSFSSFFLSIGSKSWILSVLSLCALPQLFWFFCRSHKNKITRLEAAKSR